MNKTWIFALAAFMLAGCGTPAASSSSTLSSSQEVSSTTAITENSSEIEKSSSIESSEATSYIETSDEVSIESSGIDDSSSDSLETSTSHFEPIDNHKLYHGYYADLDSWTDGEDLKKQLHDIIHGGTYQPIEYNHNSISNWQSNRDADQDLYDLPYLDVVYSGDKVNMNDTWQREHAFCASLMTGSLTGDAVKTLGRATDFHNLFASFASGNSSRGNKNFGNADKNADSYQNRLDKWLDGYSFDNKNFEPSYYDKGRLARAIFYMATMYSEPEYDPVNNITMQPLKVVEDYVDYVPGNECAFAHGNLSTLLEWAENCGVDLLEYQHNESVYSFVPNIHTDESKNHAQGNRNPYVDFPELVTYAFGDKKDEPGTFNDMISSYAELHKWENITERYAIKNAKRKYVVGNAIEKDDIEVVAIDNERKYTDFVDFSLDGIDFGDVFEETGNFEITIKTPLNNIHYEVQVVNDDPLSMAQYKHNLTGKAAGCDFASCYANKGVDNRLDLSGVLWDIYWEKGEVSSTSSKFGCKFGANASNPVGKARFKTAEAFSFNNLNQIIGVCIEGSTASGCSYPVKIKVGDTEIYSGNIAYINQDKCAVLYGKVDEPITGVISIEVTNITNALYIKTIAVVLAEE